MTKKIKVSELPEFDVTEYLNNEVEVIAYLTAVLEDGDPELLAAALGDISRSRGMTQVATHSGRGRGSPGRNNTSRL